MLGLEFGVVRCSWERDYVADVRHSGHEQQQTFEPEAESAVGGGAPASSIEIPPQFSFAHAEFGMRACVFL